MKLSHIYYCAIALLLGACGPTNDSDIVKDILEGKQEVDLNQFTWVNEPK